MDGSKWGIWKITEIGKQRLAQFNKTHQDSDEGLTPLMGVDASISSEDDVSPAEGFDKIENIQVHETGGILGVGGIVYEPINEQGVIQGHGT